MTLFEKTKKFVENAFNGNESDILHAKRTAYWVKFLKPDADEVLLVAAVSHDIERAVYGDWKKGSNDPKDLEKHQNQSAEVIEKFLLSENASEELIQRVKSLVSHHQVGGDADQNILCEADNLAFFEKKALRRVEKLKEEGEPKEKIREKFETYFSRFKSEKARQIAKKWYDEAMEELDK